jgi:hypothetical protein
MPGNQAGESLDDWFAHLPFESLFLSFFAVQILCCGTSTQSGVVKVNSFGCTTQPRRVHLECFPVDPSLAPLQLAYAKSEPLKPRRGLEVNIHASLQPNDNIASTIH